MLAAKQLGLELFRRRELAAAMYEGYEYPIQAAHSTTHHYGFPQGPPGHGGYGPYCHPTLQEEHFSPFHHQDHYPASDFRVPAGPPHAPPPPYPAEPVWRPHEMQPLRKRKNLVYDNYESEEEDEDDSKFSRLDVEDTKKYARQNHSEIEKRRRDKMNSYITELSSMVPMCNAMNRKLDKLTVLRMAVQHMKTLHGECGASHSYTEASHKPSFLSDDELKHLILKAASGFLFVVGCDRGRILYVSESVKNTLNYTQSDLIGQSLFDVLHPKDIGKVKEQLSSSDLAPRERLIDAKTMLPVKTELPHRATRLCSGVRRSFFCRMKCANKAPSTGIKVEKKLDADVCHRKKKLDRQNFSIIHCTGYLKSWSSSRVGMEEDGEGEEEEGNLSCLVAVGRVKPICSPYNIPDNSTIHVRQTEFVSRHSVDGKFTYIDQRVTIILGYLPQELLSSSVYEYYHQEDIQHLAEIHRKVLRSKEKVETGVFRFKAKDGSFLHLRARSFSFHNPWTKEVEYIVTTNVVVPMQEVTSSSQHLDMAETSGMLMEEDREDSKLDEPMEASCHETVVSGGLTVPGVPGGTRAGAGRIGRQIADEVIDVQGLMDSPLNADSSNMPSPSQAEGSVKPASAAESARADSASNPIIPNHPGYGNHMLLSGQNGLNFGQHVPVAEELTLTENSLIESVINEDMQDFPGAGDYGNDEAAMAVIMSLLEADAGLGGPVDFNDLPWPL